jgi:type IV pilus biogenesis protein CpaD/CtpE
MASPKLEPLVLTDEERQVLEGWARRRKTAQALALRSRIVLACANAAAVSAVAADLRISRTTAGKWRSRFVEAGLEGLSDEPLRAGPALSPTSSMAPNRPAGCHGRRSRAG